MLHLHATSKVLPLLHTHVQQLLLIPAPHFHNGTRGGCSYEMKPKPCQQEEADCLSCYQANAQVRDGWGQLLRNCTCKVLICPLQAIAPRVGQFDW